MIRFLEVIFILLLDLVLLGRVMEYCYAGYKFLRTHYPSLGLREDVESMAPSIEEPAEVSMLRGKYDVDAFRQRIAELQKDADGLYDVPVEPPRADFTGTEIITDNFEKEIDRRFTL